MGDHRFSFKATFEMHGVRDELDLGWHNWSGGAEGIDSRIEDWLLNAVKRSMVKYDEQCAKYFAEQNKAAIEQKERADLARLQDKYGVK